MHEMSTQKLWGIDRQTDGVRSVPRAILLPGMRERAEIREYEGRPGYARNAANKKMREVPGREADR